MSESESKGTVVVLTTAESSGGMLRYGCWGKGETRAEALKNARKQGGKTAKYGYTVLTFAPEAEFLGVNDMGMVSWRGPAPAEEEVAPTTKKTPAKK